MRAWTCRRYGGLEHLALESLPRPSPKKGEVLVRILATTVSSADWRVRTLTLPKGFGPFGRLAFGFRGPRQPIFGTEFSGVVESVGPGVEAFAPGDAVVGFTGVAQGAHAEFRVLSATKALARKPANLSFPEAAALSFGGTTALHYLRRANLRAGERVLVLGAAGAVGSALVQLARARGAHVTGTTRPQNREVVETLGAHEVHDYVSGGPFPQGGRFDVIADAVGATSFSHALAHLNEHGRYLSIAGTLGDLLARSRGTKTTIGGPAPERAEDIQELVRLAEEGAFKPLVGRVFPFEELPAAHALVEGGHKRGSAVVSVAEA